MLPAAPEPDARPATAARRASRPARSAPGVLVVLAAVLCASLAACGPFGGDAAVRLERATTAPLPTAPPPPFPPPTPEQIAIGARPLVGAHYYHWFPGNWSGGTLRGQLDPPQQPVLGWYSSTDPAVAEQHIAWASAHGIDFFTLDWWPVGHPENQAGIAAFLRARNIADVGYSIFYETWNLNWDERRAVTVFDEPTRRRFVDDMVRMADEHFAHPSYLRVGGRPVIFLYLTRVLVGDVAGALAEARAAWRDRGFDPLVIGDELFWKVTVAGSSGRFTSTPQVARIGLFDAITTYNPYESSRPDHGGYGADSRFVADVNGLYRRYHDATGGAVPLVPGVLPGYNDRPVRPSLANYVIPRRWAADAPEGSFLDEMLREVGDRWLDPRLPMVVVTSWNEWNEDTAIEPLVPAPDTTADTVGDGLSRADGYAYGGHGTRYLEVLRDHFVAVSGRVVLANGLPARGRVVSAWRDGTVVAQDVTDVLGRYTLARAQVGPPGPPVTISVDGRHADVALDAERTVEASFLP